MDMSTAVFTYYLVDIAPVGKDARPIDPGEGGSNISISGGGTFVRDRQFRVSRVLNHFSRINSRGSMLTCTQPTTT
jgi:hypothetical protein